jgi:hypothetical protein
MVSKVDALIELVMAEHRMSDDRLPGQKAQLDYYEAVHQELAPLARYLEQENEKLRKIAAHVPARTYIAAKEAAGFGAVIKLHNVKVRGCGDE